TEALCEIEGVELEEVRGGTFVHFGDDFAWLPGLVRAPSLRLDRERDALMSSLLAKNERLQARAIDMARTTPIGTFARAQRTWAWAWAHPNLAETARKAAAALTDALPDRDLWEITTPTFATDEPTAWLLAALICDRAGANGVKQMVRDDVALFVLVRDVQAG